MKLLKWSACTIIGTAFALTAGAANLPPGHVDFGKFTAAAGKEFVEVNLQSNLIAMVARLAEKAEPQIAELVGGLKQIRVNVIGLDDANREEVLERVKGIRAQLEAQGWDSIVTAQEKHEDVRVYVKTRGAEALEGVVVTVLDGKKEAVLVNVVGDFKPEKLAELGERFGIDPLKKLGKPLRTSKR